MKVYVVFHNFSPIFRQHGIRIDNILPDELSSDLAADRADAGPSLSTPSSSRGKSWCVEYLEQHTINSTHATSTVVLQARERDLEGLTKCVLALDTLSTFFTLKCEQKAKDLQLRKNGDAVNTVNAMTQFRKKLLRILSNSNIAQTSTLTKVFVDSFKAVPVFDPPKQNQGTELKQNMKPLYQHLQDNFPIQTPTKTVAPDDVTPTTPQPAVETDSNEQKIAGVEIPTEAAANSETSTFFSWVYKSVVPSTSGLATPDKNPDKSPSKYELLRNANLISQHLVVFCYGACLVQSTPATIYITPQYVCLSMGFPGFTFTTREIYPISRLSSVKVIVPESRPASSSFSLPQIQPPMLNLVFFSGTSTKEIVVIPAVLDCKKLRILLTELKEMEPFEWFTLPSDPKVSVVGTENDDDQYDEETKKGTTQSAAGV